MNEQLKMLLDHINNQTNFYKEESVRLQKILNKLGLQLLDSSTQTILNSIVDIVETNNGIDASVESNILQNLDIECDEEIITSKLLLCIKLYQRLNKRITEETAKVSRQNVIAKEQIDEILKICDIQSLALKVAKYNRNIFEIKKNTPILNDPTLDLSTIIKKSEILKSLKSEKSKLKAKIDSYHGLQPDVSEASMQLNLIKQQINQK